MKGKILLNFKLKINSLKISRIKLTYKNWVIEINKNLQIINNRMKTKKI